MCKQIHPLNVGKTFKDKGKRTKKNNQIHPLPLRICYHGSQYHHIKLTCSYSSGKFSCSGMMENQKEQKFSLALVVECHIYLPILYYQTIPFASLSYSVLFWYASIKGQYWNGSVAQSVESFEPVRKLFCDLFP